MIIEQDCHDWRAAIVSQEINCFSRGIQKLFRSHAKRKGLIIRSIAVFYRLVNVFCILHTQGNY